MRRKYTTTIDEELLMCAKAHASNHNLSGANQVIEEALAMYFDSVETDTYEKEDKKMIYKWICSKNTSTLEIIKSRICFDQSFSELSLEEKGFIKI